MQHPHLHLGSRQRLSQESTILNMLRMFRTNAHALSITDTTLLHSTHGLILEINVLLWTLAADGILVLEDKDIVVLTEETVDILKSAPSSLRVEEVDDWYEGGVEDGPNDVKLPPQRADTNWGNLYDHKVHDPLAFVNFGGTRVEGSGMQTYICGCTESCSLCSHGKGVDFGRVQPWNTLPSNSKEDVI